MANSVELASTFLSKKRFFFFGNIFVKMEYKICLKMNKKYCMRTNSFLIILLSALVNSVSVAEVKKSDIITYWIIFELLSLKETLVS